MGVFLSVAKIMQRIFEWLEVCRHDIICNIKAKYTTLPNVIQKGHYASYGYIYLKNYYYRKCLEFLNDIVFMIRAQMLSRSLISTNNKLVTSHEILKKVICLTRMSEILLNCIV